MMTTPDPRIQMRALHREDQLPDRPRRLVDMVVVGAILGLSALFTAAFFWLVAAIRS
jgi:hypothetical protein